MLERELEGLIENDFYVAEDHTNQVSAALHELSVELKDLEYDYQSRRNSNGVDRITTTAMIKTCVAHIHIAKTNIMALETNLKILKEILKHEKLLPCD